MGIVLGPLGGTDPADAFDYPTTTTAEDGADGIWMSGKEVAPVGPAGDVDLDQSIEGGFDFMPEPDYGLPVHFLTGVSDDSDLGL